MIRNVIKKGLDVYDDDDDKTFHDDKLKNAPVKRQDRYKADNQKNDSEKFLDGLLFGAPKKKPANVAATPAAPKTVAPPAPPPPPAPPAPPIEKHAATSSPTQPSKTGGSSGTSQVFYTQPGSIITYETLVKLPHSNVFNRPAYIRKFKKVAQNYGYRERNQQNIEVDNVLRIGECYYSEVKRQQKSEFSDIEFPANYVAFVDNVKQRKIGFYKDFDNWKTAKQVFKTPVFGKYIDPNDVEKGLFPSDFLASCISSLAEREQNIKRLIEEQSYTETGFYYVRINVNGVWRYVIVDQYIPVHTDGTIVATHSYPDDQADLWPTLIEKAYTKVYGTYEQYSRPQSRELYLRDLTGAPVRLYLSFDPNIQKVIENALERGWIVQAAPTGKIQAHGLNPNITLNVLKVNGKNIQFRNSFGTLDEKPRVNINKEGVFEFNPDELRSFVNYFLIAEVFDDYCTSTVQARHKASYYSSYGFTISSNFSGYVMVSQFDPRLFNQPNNLFATESNIKVENPNHYETSPIRVLVYRKDGERLIYVAAATCNQKNLDLGVTLIPGEYILFLVMNWVGHEYDVNISIYGSELVKFKRIYNKANPYLIAQGLEADAIKEGSKVSKNGVDEYTYLHRPSGLIVVTNVNNSGKNVRHSKDLKNVKADGLFLINERNKFEKDADKLSAFEDKQWGLDLEAGEKYSWVIASRNPVDDNSLKTLGFK